MSSLGNTDLSKKNDPSVVEFSLRLRTNYSKSLNSQGESSDKVDNSVKVFFMIDFYSLKGA